MGEGTNGQGRPGERELIDILEQALQMAPNIRLDHIPKVVGHFQDALEFMKTCIDSNGLPQKESNNKPVGAIRPENLRSTTLMRSLQDLAVESGTEGEKRDRLPRVGSFAKPLEKRIKGAAVTEDYSSPSLGTRRLGDRKKKGSSGRASGDSSRARRFAADISDDEESMDFPGQASRPSTFEPVYIQNRNVEKAEGAKKSGSVLRHVTSDYSSPSLSTRRLERPKSNASSSRAEHAGAFSSDDEDSTAKEQESAQQPVDFFEEDTSRRMPDKITDSPYAASSRGRLLDLARDKEVEDKADIFKNRTQSFRRRLDSPQTSHSRLIAGREQLRKTILECLDKVQQVPLDSMDEILRRIRVATAALHAGLVTHSPEAR